MFTSAEPMAKLNTLYRQARDEETQILAEVVKPT